MKTVIMAGGKGTRISSIFPDIPKPLIPIRNKDGISKPVLQWEIESLRDQGFTDIILTVSHMHEKIEEYFGDGQWLGVKISYFIEDTPLGNAGALFKMQFTEDFLLLNADSVFDVDFGRMIRFHQERKALVTLFTHPNSHPYDSGLIISDEDGAVVSWITKEEKRPQYYKNRVNAGLHIVNPIVLDMMMKRTKLDPDSIGKLNRDGKTITVDLDRQILKPLCGSNTMFVYDSPEYVKDMGTPERYKQVSRDFYDGIINAKNLSFRQRAIFLDRDGTINRYVGFLREPKEFELEEGVSDAIRLINESGFLAIVITNQPVIARGEVTIEQLNEIHNKMETLLGYDGAYIDAIYYCPHHPHSGYEGEIKSLKIECDCRKPKPGLLLKAAMDYNIDLSHSWMIGDGENDIMAGKNAGTHTAYLCSDCSDEKEADLIENSLLDIVKKIICC